MIYKVSDNRKAKDVFYVKVAEAHFAANDYNEAVDVIYKVSDVRKAKDAFYVKVSEAYFAEGDLEECFEVYLTRLGLLNKKYLR